MRSSDIRQRYINFFISRGHQPIPPVSLIPDNDPTTLFTGSGMQPLLPYLLGGAHPQGKRLVDSQRCFRAEDVDEVGDNRHTTFFEMLGNWSLGDYFKAEQLPWFFEFLTTELGIDPQHIYVTVFSGDETSGVPRDDESIAIWQKLFQEKGIEAKAVDLGTLEKGAELGLQGGRIFAYGVTKNWWSRAGAPAKMPPGEPGGPDSEVFYEFTEIPHDPKFGANCHPNCDCGRFMEIGNSVFMEYRKLGDGSFERLPQQNVDFGGGLERMAAAATGDADVFNLDLFQGIITLAEAQSKTSYAQSEDKQRRAFRIVADHLRAATFLIADGAEPSNKERGYVTRRFLRRAVRYMDVLGMTPGKLASLIEPIVVMYEDVYPQLRQDTERITLSVATEEDKFRKTLARGLKEFAALIGSQGKVSGRDAFVLFSTYGFPLEMTIELAEERGLPVDREGFRAEFTKHKELSRTATAGTFKGGLADHSFETTRGHTATHLLHATLRKVLGDHVLQKGSNITPERLRFDFSHPEKLTPEQLKQIEDMMNDVIRRDLPVNWQEMTFDEAQKAGALGLFEHKYGDKVKVYTMGGYSCEVCGGPHVEHTAQVGTFKIIKEEAISAGIRRIKATVN